MSRSFLLFGFAVLSAHSAQAAANLSASTAFTAADGLRTTMDIGGAWNGSSDGATTTGDTFAITLQNTGDLPASVIVGSVTLPSGFSYVANTVSGIGGITASQVGTALTFTISSTTAIGAGTSSTISFGLVTSTSVTAGTYGLSYFFSYSTGTVGPVAQSIVVKAGATTLAFNPSNQTKSVSQTAVWDVVVTNTGLGGLFDVPIDESLINPNPANSLQVVTMTQTSPASPTATGSLPVLTLPYLASGSSYTVHVVANVTGCSTITNNASTTDRTSATAKTGSAQVTLDLQQPLITYSPPTANLDYSTTTHVSFLVQNTGMGDATGVILGSNLPGINVTVTNVASGWTYNSGTGAFAKTTSLVNMMNSTLSFDLAPTNVCTANSNGTVLWSSQYTNVCGNAFTTPSPISSVNNPTDAPSVSVTKTSPDSRLRVGSASTYVLGLSATNLANIASDPILVKDIIPTGISGVSVTPPAGTTAGCGGACVAGSTLTWSVPHSQLGSAVSLTINFTASTNTCLGGTFLNNTAVVTSTSTQACSLGASQTASILLINDPDASAVFNIDPLAGANGYTYETGAVDNGNATRDAGEGEFITFESTYSFSMGYPGTWSGSTYVDNFGTLTGQTLVPGTLQAAADGGSFSSVPNGSITQSTGSLSVDLTFLSGGSFANDVNVGNHTITFQYKTVHPDSDLGGASSRLVTQLATLTVNGGTGNGSCGGGATRTFTQGTFYTIARATATLAITGVPNVVDICQVIPTSFTVTNGNVEQASNILTTAITSGDYEFLTATAPVYSGDFTGSNITYTPNSGNNPTFQYTPSSSKITTGGTIFFYTRRKALSSLSTTGFTGQVAFDDVQTSTSSSPDFTSPGLEGVSLVRKANLAVTMSPQNYAVVGSTAQWTIYVTNTGNGTAFNTTLQDVIPSAFTANATATNALNPSYGVSVNGSTLTWNLGDIGPGQTVTIQPLVNPNGTSCSVPAGSNATTSQWGCGGTNVQTVNSTSPDFTFPTGQLQILHDTSSSFCALCGTGKVEIIARNTGSTHVTSVQVGEVLNPLSTGVDLVPGSVEYSNDNGNTWNATSDPTGSGTTGSPYLFNSTQAPALADLYTQAESGVYQVLIRFSVSSNETANGTAPQITASGTGNVFCGGSVSSPGTLFSLTRQRPDFTLTKVGRNVTAGQAGYASTVYAVPGDQVEWKVTVSNNGNATSFNTRLADVFPNSGGTLQGTLNGEGYTAYTLANNFPIPIPQPTDQVLASSSVVYLVSETIGATCVDQNNTADVTWGCTNNGTNARSNLTSPTNNTGTAALVMLPSYTSQIAQTFTPLPGGRTEIAVTITNTGSTAQNLQFTDTLPAGQAVDTSFTPTLSSTGSITAVAANTTSLTVPIFTLTGTMAHNDTFTVRFRIIQTGNFDTTACRFQDPETTGTGCDPALPPSGSNVVALSYNDMCNNAANSSNSATLDPQTPDVDITVTPTTKIFTAGTSYTFTYTLTNNGDSGSIADHLTFTPVLGGGLTAPTYTVTTPGTGGTSGTCATTCTSAQLGTLAAGQSAVVTITATAQNNGSPDTALGRIVGEIYTDSGTATGNDYTYDEAQPATLGFSAAMTFASQSESFATGSNVPVGGEATWTLNGAWFGNDPSSGINITSIDVRDSLPSGLGFVSFSTTSNNTMTIVSVSSPTPVATGRTDFLLSPISSSGTFETNFTARVLNIGTNNNGTSLTNNLGLSFIASSMTFASNNASDGFGGSQSTLHAQNAITVAKPVMTFSKLVRNVTNSGTFASMTTGDAGDILEYQLVLTNSGGAPAFDLSAADVLQTSKLVLINGNSDGIDNDGDGLIDGADSGGEGAYDVAQGSAIFTDANTGLTSGTSLGRLNTGHSVTLIYRATAQNTVVPGDLLQNKVTFKASTLPGNSGNETVPFGVSGSSVGESVFSSTAAATLDVSTLTFTKSILNTAVGGDTSANVYVGEQVEFQLLTVLPEGSIPSFVVTDKLPSNLSLVQTPAPTLGSAITGCNSPTITPSTLPASGSPLVVQWNFGNCSVASGSTSGQKTVTITYLSQVVNSTSNVNGSTIVNNSSYSFTGAPGNQSAVTMTVQESTVTFTQTVSPASADAGDLLTYTLSLHNTGSAPAYDVNIVSVLPSNATYKTASTTAISGSITEPDVSGSTVTWGRNQGTPQSLTINGGATLSYTFQAKLADGVLPGQTLSASSTADWTSLPGSPGPNLGAAVGAAGASLGERNGSGGVNSYVRTVSTNSVASSSFTLTKVESGDTVSGGGFRIGDLVTYTVSATVPEGTMNNVSLQDTLPAGLALFDSQAISPASGGNFTYTAPTAPATASTGTITWTIGTLVNAGDNNTTNNTLTLQYRARVMNTGGIAVAPATQSLNNAAVLNYTGGAGAVQVSAPVATIQVKQPILGISKALGTGQGLTTLGGAPIHYSVTVSNSGTAPAYDTVVQDQLPAGTRGVTPVVTAATINGSGATISSITYVSGTGLVSFALTDAQPINPAATAVINYDVTVDSPIANGTTFVNSATVASFDAKSSTDTTQRRVYAPVGPVSALTVTAQAAVLAIAKAVNLTNANPGDTVHYTITMTNGGSIAASSATLVDSLDAHLQPGSLANVSVSPNTGTTAITPTGGSHGTGLLTISNMMVGVGQTITIGYDAKIAPNTAFGSVIYNQASLSVPGFPSAFTTNIATTTIQTAPILHVQKTSVAGATPLAGGSTLTYTLTLTNSGSEKAINATLIDPIPGNTRYVPGTTTLNGTAAPDNSGVSPLVAGLNVHAATSPAGEIPVGSTVTVVFAVTVDTGLASGTQITNQATLNAQGATFGTLPPELSDDPSLPGAHDPTQNVVGQAALIYAAKKVTDLNGGFLAAGDLLRYDITLHNTGSSDATHVVLVDTIPVHTTYVAGSILYDADGSGPGPVVAQTDAADSDIADYNATNVGAITATLATLPAGAEMTLSFTVQVVSGTPNGTLISNQGAVHATNVPDGLTDGDGNSSNGSQPTLIIVGNMASLQFTKVATDLNGGVLAPGDTIEYTLTALNVGASSATNVRIADPIVSSATAYLSGSTLLNGQVVADDAGANSVLARVGGYDIGAILPTQSAVMTFKVIVAAADTTGTTLPNTATVVADSIASSSATASLAVGGAQGSANVSGYVWRDNNHNRIFDLGEPPEPGWLVELYRFGAMLVTSTSDANGYYQFLGMATGSGYEIRFVNPASNAVFGSPVSTQPGVDLSHRTIADLTLNSGSFVINQSLPLDPSGVVYDAATRKPLKGATVRLVGPGGVDVTSYLLPGQQGQITGDDGYYELDLVGGFSAGVYTIALTPPANYSTSWPSSLLPPQSGSFTPGPADPTPVVPGNTAPQSGDSTVYYTSFNLSPGGESVVNNHLPVDPILSNALLVSKTAQVQNASVGDLVPYTITVTNLLASTVNNANLIDQVPAGFKYRAGTGRLNDVKDEPTMSGRMLTWAALSFQAHEVKTFRLLLIVGSGVGEGKYVNNAWAVNGQLGSKISNVSGAAVRIIPDPTFDCTDIIGKVFDDRNQNGYPDRDEPGIAGARVITVDGLVTTTDGYGRYHIACAVVPDETLGENVVLKVDPRTIPQGYHFTSENPLVRRVTRGKMARFDFGIAMSHVVRLELGPTAFVAPVNSIPVHETWETVRSLNAIAPIHFATAFSQLEPGQIAALRTALAKISQLPDVRRVRVLVEGHTDNAPIVGNLRRDIADNKVLSIRRARTVAHYIRAQLNLPPEMIDFDGYGDSRPIASNKTPEGRAINRRAEISVVYEQKRTTATFLAGAKIPSAKPTPLPWLVAVDGAIDVLSRQSASLHLAYCPASDPQAAERLSTVEREILSRWTLSGHHDPLVIVRDPDACPPEPSHE